MPLSFETDRGTMKWYYNPEYIGFDSSKLIVEHQYPHRQGAETEDMGRQPVRVEVRGIFLQNPAMVSPKPEIFINNLWRLHDVGAIGKVYDSELGEAVEGRLFRISNLKANRDGGTVGDIPYSFTFVEHVPPQSSTAAAKNSTGIVGGSSNGTSGQSTRASNGSGSTPQARDITYIVKSGDTLWGIAKDHYKDAGKFKQIMLDNKVDVSDMKPGIKLLLKGVPNRG